MKITGPISFVCFLFLATASRGDPTVRVSNGSPSDVQAKIDEAADGDTVAIPAGSFTWGKGVTIRGKGITLQGAGGGRNVGRSISANSVGTGSKTFAVLLSTKENNVPAMNVGDSVRVTELRNRGWMEGTIVAYSAGALTMDVTTTNGSGSYNIWYFSTPATTTVIDNTTVDYAGMIKFTEASVPTVISNIRFISRGTNASNWMIELHDGPSRALIHDCRFITNGAGIRADSNRVTVWNCSFEGVGEAVQWVFASGAGSWTSPDTIGTHDTDGATNFYVEDCDFVTTGIGDADRNSRVVVRHCLWNNTGMASHGADTGSVGVRHVEIYDNEMVFSYPLDAADTYGLQWWYYLRGGTAVITDNLMQNIISSIWGDKPEILMTMINLQRDGGADLYACWGSGRPNHNGVTYGTNTNVVSISATNPAVVTTSSAHNMTTGMKTRIRASDASPSLNDTPLPVTVLSETTFSVPVAVTAAGTATGVNTPIDYPAPMQPGQGHNGTENIADPIYIWNNSGAQRTDIGGEAPNCGPYTEVSNDFLQAGRDFFSDGTPRPAYTKFAFPHPSRNGNEMPPRPSSPQNLHIVQ